jgi:predicted kinase
MRGLPGSGKSTLARRTAAEHMRGCGSSVAICSTDDYHMEGEEYVFKPEMLAQFHGLNHLEAQAFMELGTELVIIDNTNIRHRDMKPYKDSADKLGYDVTEIIVEHNELFPSLDSAEPHKFDDYIDLCAKRNTHGVPREAIERMARRFEK